jgi:hypothetical protein
MKNVSQYVFSYSVAFLNVYGYERKKEFPMHRIRQLSEKLTGRISTITTAKLRSEEVSERRWRVRFRRSDKAMAREDPFRDWQNWSKFRLWRHTRPLWGSIFMLLGACIMLGDAVFFLSLAFLAQSLWPAILVGGLLLVMGLIPLFLPTHAVITGSIGIVLSLVSLLVASFGGCGIGLLLGLIGSTLCIAWRPVGRYRLVAATISVTPAATHSDSPG